MDILVTGAAGFIGSRLAHFLAKQYEVVACDDQRYFDLRPRSYGYPRKQIDKSLAFEWLQTQTPDAIFHLGACTQTDQKDWEFLKKWNLEYSKQLWNYATEKQIPFYYASSAATYGDGSSGYSDDESKIHTLNPLNPYGLSKHQFDLWALDQEKKGNHPPFWAGFKFFNVYGFGEQYKEDMASVAYKHFLQIQKENRSYLFKSNNPKYSDGFQTRDFISIEDVLSVLDFAWTHPLRRGIYNLGSGKERTFLDLSKSVYKGFDLKANIQFIEMPKTLEGIYQYFTKAEMQKLFDAGYKKDFLSLEEGVHTYVQQLLKGEL